MRFPGLAVFTAVLNTGLRSRFKKIEGFGTLFNVPESAAGYAQLHALPDGSTKTAVLGAFADSLRVRNATAIHAVSTTGLTGRCRSAGSSTLSYCLPPLLYV